MESIGTRLARLAEKASERSLCHSVALEWEACRLARAAQPASILYRLDVPSYVPCSVMLGEGIDSIEWEQCEQILLYLQAAPPRFYAQWRQFGIPDARGLTIELADVRELRVPAPGPDRYSPSGRRTAASDEIYHEIIKDDVTLIIVRPASTIWERNYLPGVSW